jgi:hypothetical protein
MLLLFYSLGMIPALWIKHEVLSNFVKTISPQIFTVRTFAPLYEDKNIFLIFY